MADRPISDFLTTGYLFEVSCGEYSSRIDTLYVFNDPPDMERIKSDIDVAYSKSVGNCRGNMATAIQDIIESHGGKSIAYCGSAWTDGYGMDNTTLQDNFLGKSYEWRAKERPVSRKDDVV